MVLSGIAISLYNKIECKIWMLVKLKVIVVDGSLTGGTARQLQRCIHLFYVNFVFNVYFFFVGLF